MPLDGGNPCPSLPLTPRSPTLPAAPRRPAREEEGPELADLLRKACAYEVAGHSVDNKANKANVLIQVRWPAELPGRACFAV